MPGCQIVRNHMSLLISEQINFVLVLNRGQHRHLNYLLYVLLYVLKNVSLSNAFYIIQGISLTSANVV